MRRSGSVITKLKGDKVAFPPLFVTKHFQWPVIPPSQYFIRCYLALCESQNTQISSHLWHQPPWVCGGHLDFILAGVPGQQPCCELLLNTRSLGLPHSPGQVNGWRGHGELLKFSQCLGLRLQQQEASWLLHWGWGGGETPVWSMGYSAVVLKCSPLIITLRTHAQPWGLAMLLIRGQQTHLALYSGKEKWKRKSG